MRQCNLSGLSIIKSFEGCKLVSYQDGNGIWTIGYGHTGKDIHEGLRWTQNQADQQFLADIQERANVPVDYYAPEGLTENQFSAFCSLCYNIGSGNFEKSTALKLAKAERLDDVPSGISMWNKIGGITSDGLVRRRSAEILLWKTPDMEEA